MDAAQETTATVLARLIRTTLTRAKASDPDEPSRLVDISALSALATTVNELAAAYHRDQPGFDIAAFRKRTLVMQAEAAVLAYAEGLA